MKILTIKGVWIIGFLLIMNECCCSVEKLTRCLYALSKYDSPLKFVSSGKVDAAAASAVATNFCWLSLIGNVIKRKAYVGRVDLSLIGIVLRFQLALFPEIDAKQLIKKLEDEIKKGGSEGYLQGMDELKKILETWVKSEQVDEKGCAEEIIGCFTQKQLDQFLKDFFIMTFQDVLAPTNVLKNKISVFVTRMPFEAKAEDLLASLTYGFGTLLTRLRLNKNDVGGFFVFLQNDVVGALGAVSNKNQSAKIAHERLSPLVDALKNGAGWKTVDFKTEITTKEDDKASVDDELMIMVTKAFFDEFFFASFEEVLKNWNTQALSNNKPMPFDAIFLKLDEQRSLEALFFQMLPRCEPLVKNSIAFTSLKVHLLKKNKKITDELIQKIKTLKYSSEEDQKSQKLFIQMFEESNKGAQFGANVSIFALDAALELISGLRMFYKFGLSGVSEQLVEPEVTHMKKAPDGSPLFRACQYDELAGMVKESDNPKEFWSKNVVFGLIDKIFELVKIVFDLTKKVINQNPFDILDQKELIFKDTYFKLTSYKFPEPELFFLYADTLLMNLKKAYE